MFDSIAPRYDLLNRVLSAGLDQRWRHRAVRGLALGETPACWTSAPAPRISRIAIAETSPRRVGGRRRFLRRDAAAGAGKGARPATSDARIRLVRGDATEIPLPDRCCDAATIGFGIRNVAEPERALAELARVLRPGARLAILEFGQPRIPGIRTLYSWYFRYLLPAVGKTGLPSPERLFVPARIGRHVPAAGRVCPDDRKSRFCLSLKPSL